jgi:hypothetical protein
MPRSQSVADLFSTGRIVDCIIALMILELFVLAVVHWRTRSGIAPLRLIVSLAAGAALLLALRAALLGAAWQNIAPWLILALAAHLVDLKMRWGGPHTPRTRRAD